MNRLWLAAVLCAPLLAACASTGPKTVAVPQPFPVPRGEPTTLPSPGEPRVAEDASSGRPDDADAFAALIDSALELRGTPYTNGGSTPNGFDCSGFTQFVFAQYGIRLPREVRDQYRVGTEVRRNDLRPGDLLFFATTSAGPSHVAIAIGGDRFVHAPSSRGVVRVEGIRTDYWARRFLGIRRLTLP